MQSNKLSHLTKTEFLKDFQEKHYELHGKEINEVSDYSKYETLAELVRDYIAVQRVKSDKRVQDKRVKQVYYFSMEFLLGRLLSTNLINLGIRDLCKETLSSLDIDLEKLEDLEYDQGLGNGGLGRLAACFLDSMASLGIAGNGCGIRYRYGFFKQKIVDDAQVELPDNWLKEGNVWEFRKPDRSVEVRFGGFVNVDNIGDSIKFTHLNYEAVMAVPYDTPIVGFENGIVNTLRLWSAEPTTDDFDYSYFSKGEYLKSIEYRNSVEAISQVLYPDDSYEEGRILRLKQQYFFVSAGIQSIIRTFKSSGNSLDNFDEKVAIHINDTHPALAVPELMRILMDEEGFGWDDAWRITTRTISYTNHTIMAEALEKWSEDLVKRLLPRIYMIIDEINRRFCEKLWNKYIGQWDKISRMAVIADGYIKMAHLAIVGSHSVNGVAKLHTEILKKQEMSDFYYYYPFKFNNKTNGITHRRWLLNCNPLLTNLLKETIGDSFITHPTDMEKFESFVYKQDIQDKLYDIKKKNKEKLAKFIKDTTGILVDTESIFDVQVKRIHAYKRQMLNAFHIIDLYNRLKEDPNLDIVPRTFIFGGKAAPAYFLAKKIIKFINCLADRINSDKTINDRIKVVFLENYRVSLAEKIIPATDLSEQISTTTKEASGTSNMKFMMNGAVTIATLDGANIEIRDEVGDDNIVIFGLKEQEVLNYYRYGGYSSMDYIRKDPRIKNISEILLNGRISREPEDFRVIYDALFTYNDEFFVIKDFDSYIEAQAKVNDLYKDRRNWQKMAGVNISHSGIFSSDRTIMEYAMGIWGSNCIYKNL